VGTGAANRVSLTFTPTAGSLTLTVTGTASRAQLETGTVATSFIPTFGATVTRALDQYQVPPASINYSATAGSWWVEQNHIATSATSRQVGYTTGSAAPMTHNGTSFLLFEGTSLSKAFASVVGVVSRSAVAFASGDRALTAGGLAAATDAGATTNHLNPGIIYFGSGPATAPMNGYIRKIYYLPRRMTNAELATATT
jgi:hypothetical protein